MMRGWLSWMPEWAISRIEDVTDRFVIARRRRHPIEGARIPFAQVERDLDAAPPPPAAGEAGGQ